MTAGQTCLPPTGRGRPAAQPGGFYQPDPSGGLVSDGDGILRVAFAGEDGRTRTYSFDQLPLPGMHEDLAAAFLQRTGPTGTRRTLASANFTWFKLGGMLRFLAGLPRPPQDLAALRRSHLERLRRHRMLTEQPLTVSKEMAEIFGLLRCVGQQCLQPEVRELINQRGRHLGEDTGPGLPGYSDREHDQILRAARRRAVQIRDRIRAGERLLTLAETDPGQLHGEDAAVARWLAEMARTGIVPGRLRGGGWPQGNLPDRAGRVHAAQQLFLTGEDLVPLLVLAVALTGRNPETVKELPAEHRVLEERAVAVSITKRRRGKALARQTVHWEIGPTSRQLHTPGGFYLLMHELTRRSRAFSGTTSLWSIWTGRSGVNGHAGPFGSRLTRGLDLSRWAAAEGLTADAPDGSEPAPLVLRLDRLKTTAEARRAKATGGHLPSTATTNTMDVSYMHYLRNDPVIRAWAEDIIDAALADAEDSARSFQVRVLGPQIRDLFRADPEAAARELGTTPARLGQALAGALDTLATSCLDIDHSPFGSGRCTASFLMCLHCPNALVLERHLPMLYALLDRLQEALGQMTVPDWCRAHGVTWLIITRLILPEFSMAQREAAMRGKPAADLAGLLYLLPGPREPS
jgi:hypothetical protein